jgi:phage tail-like protein
VAIRDNPYGAFNFLVSLGDLGDEEDVAGGFSEVTGLANEVKYVEYRNGNDPQNHVRKIPTLNVTHDVVLKRGLIGDTRLFEWLRATREGTFDARTVIIVLLDEARVQVCEFRTSAGAAEEVGRPCPCGEGQRRGGHHRSMATYAMSCESP